MQLLIERGAVLNTADQGGATPLHWAVHGGSKSAVEFLLNRGADISMVANLEGTSLHLAALKGNEDVVKILLGRGANPTSSLSGSS